MYLKIIWCRVKIKKKKDLLVEKNTHYIDGVKRCSRQVSELISKQENMPVYSWFFSVISNAQEGLSEFERFLEQSIKVK